MKLALFLLIWGIPAFLYIVLPLILWAVEIPLLRRLRNYSIGNGFTPCTHERVVQTGFYSGKCVDCEAEMGEGSRRKFHRGRA